MVEPLSRLKIEYWYHALMVIGAAGALVAMTVELKGVANAHALVMSLGILCVGMGEWINHPLQTKLMPPNFYARSGGVITSHPRSNSVVGVLFDILGFTLAAIAIYKIVQAT